MDFMKPTELYTLSVFAGKLINCEKLTQSDYIKVVKLFAQFQYLLARLFVTRFYYLFLARFVESKLRGRIPAWIRERYRLDVKEKEEDCSQEVKAESRKVKERVGGVNMSRMKDSTMAVVLLPLHTVKAATKAGVKLTGMVTGAPSQAWAMVNKVTNTIKGRGPEPCQAPPSNMDYVNKKEFVQRLLKAKAESGKTFAQIAEECKITNVYCAQLLHNQAQLKCEVAVLLKRSLPALTEDDIVEMSRAPRRSFDQHVLQEPIVTRLNEVVCHYGESIKELVNEDFGDGVMSTEDFYVTLEKVKGDNNEDRIVIAFNGKFSPYVTPRVDPDL